MGTIKSYGMVTSVSPDSAGPAGTLPKDPEALPRIGPKFIDVLTHTAIELNKVVSERKRMHPTEFQKPEHRDFQKREGYRIKVASCTVETIELLREGGNIFVPAYKVFNWNGHVIHLHRWYNSANEVTKRWTVSSYGLGWGGLEEPTREKAIAAFATRFRITMFNNGPLSLAEILASGELRNKDPERWKREQDERIDKDRKQWDLKWAAREFQAERPTKARRMDRQRTNKRTLQITEKNVKRWKKAPGHSDLEGVDTP